MGGYPGLVIGSGFGSKLRVPAFPEKSQEVPRGPRKVPGRSQEVRKGPEGSQEVPGGPEGPNGGMLLGNPMSENHGRIPRSGPRLRVLVLGVIVFLMTVA